MDCHYRSNNMLTLQSDWNFVSFLTHNTSSQSPLSHWMDQQFTRIHGVYVGVSLAILQLIPQVFFGIKVWQDSECVSVFNHARQTIHTLEQQTWKMRVSVFSTFIHMPTELRTWHTGKKTIHHGHELRICSHNLLMHEHGVSFRSLVLCKSWPCFTNSCLHRILTDRGLYQWRYGDLGAGVDFIVDLLQGPGKEHGVRIVLSMRDPFNSRAHQSRRSSPAPKILSRCR